MLSDRKGKLLQGGFSFLTGLDGNAALTVRNVHKKQQEMLEAGQWMKHGPCAKNAHIVQIAHINRFASVPSAAYSEKCPAVLQPLFYCLY